MTINYITYDSWWDTDTTIIPVLAQTAEVHVFCLNPGKELKYKDKKVPENVSLVQVTQKYRDRDIRSIWIAIKYYMMAFLFSKKKDDVFFFIPGKNPFLLLLVLLLASKNRTIISSHNYLEHGDNNSLGGSLGASLKKRMYEKFRFFHFFSRSQLDLFKKDYPSKKAFYTDMPLKDYGSATQVVRSDDKITLLFFGLIRDYKRLDWLIKAVKTVDSNRLRVVVAGKVTDRDKDKYTTMIGSSNNFSLHFGFVDNKEIPGYFINSDFLVLPYDSATQSGPSLIAVNYGIPIIASDVPTFRSIIRNGKNGYLFRTDSFDDFCNVLKHISAMNHEEIESLKEGQRRFRTEYEEDEHSVKFMTQSFMKMLK